jgi:hypothetical protein
MMVERSLVFDGLFLSLKSFVPIEFPGSNMVTGFRCESRWLA